MELQADADKIFSLAKRRGFFWPAYEIYGGAAGFYDYGPLGSRLKQNVIDAWRGYYVVKEGCAEIDSPNIAPEAVFEASGHLAEFSDLLVACKGCGSAYRADLFLEESSNKAMEKAAKKGQDVSKLNAILDSVNDLASDPQGISKAIEENGFKCFKCGGDLGEPEPFNLMFRTDIGPGSGRTGYLRPETAQSMFMNFTLLYKYFREALPFGVVQVGKGFRNEISPRQGLIRQREFFMMEAEVFFDPSNKDWPRFDSIKDEVLSLYIDGQIKEVTCGDCIDQGVLSSQALAYFMGLTKRFLLHVGVHNDKLRFRRHGDTEMAHYANDCWDAEILSSLGWIECVGIADRGEFDLSQHINSSGQELKAFQRFDEPVKMDKVVVKADPKKLGPLFKKDAGKVMTALNDLDLDAVPEGNIKVNIDGKDVDVPTDCYSASVEKIKSNGRKFIPHVIEPSYGLDRILYSIMEHSYSQREDYTVMKLPSAVAPIHVGVFPLMNKDGLDLMAKEIETTLREAGYITSYDHAGSIGRRYARMDEVGTPLCITVDYDSKEDGTVTLRDRDSTNQIRLGKDDVVETVGSLMSGKKVFADLI